MSFGLRHQLLIWGGLGLVLALVLWRLGDVLLPFVLGATLAYFLDPLADRLQRAGLGRVAATVLVSLAVVLAFVLSILLVVPLLVDQFVALRAALPDLIERGYGLVNDYLPAINDPDSALRGQLARLGEAVQARSGELVNAVLGSAMSVFSLVLLVVVVPVVAFYLLLDWDVMVARIDEMLPRQHAPTIRKLAREVDETIAAFVRGMGTVCLVMGVYYAAGLMLVGLQFGLVIGAITGLITFIPYVGAVIGGVLAFGFALVQFWGDWMSLALVAAIFVGGQMLEGNVLTPKLVGGSVKLHPVWLIFALSVFGALFGFVGMLVAVPVAAAIGVLARHFIGVYQHSALYSGTGAQGVILPREEAPRGVVTNDDGNPTL